MHSRCQSQAEAPSSQLLSVARWPGAREHYWRQSLLCCLIFIFSSNQAFLFSFLLNVRNSRVSSFQQESIWCSVVCLNTQTFREDNHTPVPVLHTQEELSLNPDYMPQIQLIQFFRPIWELHVCVEAGNKLQGDCCRASLNKPVLLIWIYLDLRLTSSGHVSCSTGL